EQPYKMTPKTGELYSLGVNAYLDDNYIHLHGRRTINEVNLLWRQWFDGLYVDGAATGRLMVLHLHPWIMGQPWRIRHLAEVPARKPPDPAGYSVLRAHGLRQSRRLLAHARRAEQEQGSRLLLSQPRAAGSFSGSKRRHDCRRLGLHGAWALQQPADLRLHRR